MSFEPAAALEALSSTRIARVLEGFRGQPVGGRDAVAAAVSAVSHFVADFADDITDVEINPLAVLPAGKGCSALDWVIIPRRPRQDSRPAA